MKKKKKYSEIELFGHNAIEAAGILRATTEVILDDAANHRTEYMAEYVQLLRILWNMLEPSYAVLQTYVQARDQIAKSKEISH